MSKKIELLQAGRAIAALLVIAFHANLYAPASPWLSIGAYGVDFFFVLSGFIIYRLYSSRPFDPRDFAWKRAVRIFPPYLPIGLVAAFAYLWLGYSFDWAATLFLLPGKPALTVAWTLQREAVFYALAALFLASERPLIGAGIWSAFILIGTRLELGPVGSVVLDSHNLGFVIGMCAARWLVVPSVAVGRTLNFLGDASYSLYLVHLPAMGLLWRLGAGFPVLAAGGVAAGVAYHLAVERPALRLLKPRSRRGLPWSGDRRSEPLPAEQAARS